MSPRAARALRRSLASLAVATYLAAAAMPCPPTASTIARAEVAEINGTTALAIAAGCDASSLALAPPTPVPLSRFA
jgi:hypothetical protein